MAFFLGLVPGGDTSLLHHCHDPLWDTSFENFVVLALSVWTTHRSDIHGTGRALRGMQLLHELYLDVYGGVDFSVASHCHGDPLVPYDCWYSIWMAMFQTGSTVLLALWIGGFANGIG